MIFYNSAFSLNFWSQLFMLLAAIGAVIYGVKYGYRMELLRFIPYYAMASILQESIGFYQEYINRNCGVNGQLLLNISENLFLLVEFALLTNFLLDSLLSRQKRRLTLFTSSIFLILTAYLWIVPRSPLPGFFTVSTPLFAIESLFLIIPCLFYFYELFKLLLPTNLKIHPTFWVATGILFYNSCSIPLFCLFLYFDINSLNMHWQPIHLTIYYMASFSSCLCGPLTWFVRRQWRLNIPSFSFHSYAPPHARSGQKNHH
jgi:hypothetical protein